MGAILWFADMDGDGKPDFVSTEWQGKNLGIAVNKGGGVLGATTLVTGNSPSTHSPSLTSTWMASSTSPNSPTARWPWR